MHGADSTLLGWNNLGMHCMDSDYSVFSILPPYNTIEAQLIVNGRLVTNGSGYTVTYEAVADPSGSFNSTAMGKGNYYQYAQSLYGPVLAPEGGLVGWSMPGLSNVPQSMFFEITNHPAAGVATTVNWWRAEGIPISPYDDAHQKNPYPLMLLVARNAADQIIATNQVVLPVSDEMDCRACHASGSSAAAKPAAGWVWDGLPERDFRLNILRRHDEHQFAEHPALYTAALAARGFNPQGLYRGVVADDKPVLCAVCHASEALGMPSYGTIPPLTASVHSFHAQVQDPVLNTTLDSSANRDACYRCHPGSTTRCLRGAMGGAIAADGSMEMQCQSCHGNMSTVGAPDRVGWFMEPNCASCHTGTATHNNGQIRYASVFTDTNGSVRTPVDATFSTRSNTPAPGISLYRFSTGHGGLQCEACHGSTHAEFPSTHRNDNLRNQALQGHAGVMSECNACHTNSPSTITGGPHGMHPVGTAWVSGHHNAIENHQATRSQCQVCHGLDYRGTVLSRMQADRTLNAFGTQKLFRGAIIGCYTCHDGPSSESSNANAAPTVSNLVTNTANDQAVVIPIHATGSGLTIQIISQPANGSVGLAGTQATYFPSPGFTGTDTFTFAAYDGAKNSNLATGTVHVVQGVVSISAKAAAPATYPQGWPVSFTVFPSVVNSMAAVDSAWTFGDGSASAHGQNVTHAYSSAGSYNWSVISSVAGASTTNTGTIQIEAPVQLPQPVAINGNLAFTLPSGSADVVVEATPSLDGSSPWTPLTNSITTGPNGFIINVPTTGYGFFRLRRAW